MRAYIEPDDEQYPTAIIEKRDEEGNIIEATAWLTAPKKWRIEFDDALDAMSHVEHNTDNWEWADDD